MGDAASYDHDQHEDINGPIIFPREWTVFARNFEGSFGYTLQVGVERDQPMFALRLHSNMALFGRPALTLHVGPTKDGPRVAMVKDATLNPLRPHDFDVICPPPAAGRLLDGDENVKVPVRCDLVDIYRAYKFSVAITGASQQQQQQQQGGQQLEEHFEWRHTFGGEVADLIGGPAAGWKLVRLDRNASGHGGTSDGKEVVAVWANGKKTLKEAMTFRFLNAGVTGELGDLFGLAAVVSAMGIWDHIRRERQNNPDHGGQGGFDL